MCLWTPRYVISALLALLFSFTVSSQELEPRLLTNLPVGANFAVAGYSYGWGDLLLDPAIPVEDLNGKVHTFFAGYLRSFTLLGNSAKVDVVLPYSIGNWTGTVDGIDSSRHASGFGDLKARLSMTFTGAPAVRASGLGDYEQNLITGASIRLVVPTGKYENTRVINLGSNRFTINGTIGTSKKHKNWLFELYTAVWIFLPNNDFLEGNRLTQNPLGAFKVHAIRTLPKGNWIALDAGYGLGGTTLLNGETRDTRISTVRFGLTFAIPLSRHHALKIVGISGRRLERGPDFDAFAGVYQYGWVDKSKR